MTDECPVCGSQAIRIDVGMVTPDMNDHMPAIPEDAQDYCIEVVGVETSTPIGGAVIAWHDHTV